VFVTVNNQLAFRKLFSLPPTATHKKDRATWRCLLIFCLLARGEKVVPGARGDPAEISFCIFEKNPCKIAKKCGLFG
jgi:hypothetical protein